jgi:tetratricopeptide (TPR) repeat protein
MLTTAEVLALGRRCHQVGDLSQAEALYRQVLAAAPNHVEALYLLGEACCQLRRPAEAAACFERIVRLRPGHADAWNFLGAARMAEGKLNEATACYREAVRLQPDLAGAHNNLGDALLKQGNAAAALTCLQAALRLLPKSGEVHFNLGRVYQAQGKWKEARACMEQAVRLKPDLAPAHKQLGILLVQEREAEAALPGLRDAVRLHPQDASAQSNLATALVEQGKVGEAVAHYREALRLDPNDVGALSSAAIHDFFPLAEDQVERMRTLLNHPDLPPTSAIMLHFGLAHLRQRAGDYDAAFDYFRQGNAVRRRLFQQTGRAFDLQAVHGRIDWFVRTFTPAYFRQIEGVGLDSETPVFIVGMPRSGTTLVEQILSRHRQVHGAGELHDIGRLADSLTAGLRAAGGDGDPLARLVQQKGRGLAEGYLQRLTLLGGAAVRVIDKMPMNFLHLGLIATLFPRARVFHCRRDPLDTCLSCYLQHFRELNFTSDLEDLGKFYREYERLMAHWRTALPLRLLDVSYEELVHDQEAVSRRMISFCGLDWDERCLAFHENPRRVHTMSMLQVRRPMYASSVGRWKRYDKHLEPLRKALADPEQ